MSSLLRKDNSVIISIENKSISDLVKLCLNEHISLKDANLSDIDLSGFDLSERVFENVDFSFTKLYQCNTKNTSFVNCKFDDADLSFCDFRHTNFENCSFKKCDIQSTIGDCKNIFTLVIDSYILTFNHELLCIGCVQKSIKEWKALSDDELKIVFENKSDRELFLNYKAVVEAIIDKHLERADNEILNR